MRKNMLKVNKESKAKSIVEVVKDKKESIKAKNIVKVKKEDVKSEDILFKQELLSQVKEMVDIFESTLTEITEVKVLLKSVKERFV